MLTIEILSVLLFEITNKCVSIVKCRDLVALLAIESLYTNLCATAVRPSRDYRGNVGYIETFLQPHARTFQEGTHIGQQPHQMANSTRIAMNIGFSKNLISLFRTDNAQFQATKRATPSTVQPLPPPKPDLASFCIAITTSTVGL